MTLNTKLLVNRKNYRESKAVEQTLPQLEQGQVLTAIDKFGLTANNVSYAVSGDAIGYWHYYPSNDADWGTVPVWGCASVIESRCDDIPVGERLWGFFPMASHAILQPGQIIQDQFMDAAEHRQKLPALYNTYRRTNFEPGVLQEMENERCLLFPLFATSFILSDYLIDNSMFGAEQVLIGSVSSKTGFGLAQMLQKNEDVTAKIVGLTSVGNLEFVKSLGCCDDIILYGNESDIDASIPAAYVDMSGDARLRTALHKHMGANMLESAMVGASHWEQRGELGELPGAKPKFFFAPGQLAKRDEDWGPGAAMAKAMQASAQVALTIKDDISIEWIGNTDQLASIWGQLLDNEISPNRGLMVSLLAE
jgi:hypothetical protein